MPQPDVDTKLVSKDNSDTPKITLGNSSQTQLKREAKEWLAEAKKESSTWNKVFFK